MQNQTCLSVCTRCRQPEYIGPDSQRPGYRLAVAIHARFAESAAGRLGMGLRGVRCMSQCKRPCAIALSGADKYTLIFGDLEPHRDTQAILDLAEQYAVIPDGYIPRAERPESLQSGILGRVAPLHFVNDPVDPDFFIPSSQMLKKEPV
ncbi:MAG: DUF1636 domain-containing protein [Pseudomonadota bacterium]